jgi:hypothetical protein
MILTRAAQQATGCDLALVHDDDLARIDGIYDDEVSSCHILLYVYFCVHRELFNQTP